MYIHLHPILDWLLDLIQAGDTSALDLISRIPGEHRTASGDMPRALNLAFLVALAGEEHPLYPEASSLLDSQKSNLAQFYEAGKRAVQQELQDLDQQSPAAAQRLRDLAAQLGEKGRPPAVIPQEELLWSLFHPQAAGIWGQEKQRTAALREIRRVTVSEPNPAPLDDPARQVLLTANALLTLPTDTRPLSEQALSDDLREQLSAVLSEPQAYWYDHPIQIGVQPEHNEILYGLRGLQDALEFEIEQGSTPSDAQLTCLLSVSTTHHGLQRLAHQYLAEALRDSEPLPGIRVVALSEQDCQQLITEVLAPAAQHYLGVGEAQEQLSVFGVDGAYGRHYSFLKAVTALWSVLIDPGVKATFKIDLDQVFPQETLVQETGYSAFQHLQSPLWGAHGADSQGQPVEMSMIAGALVNESDIEAGLFTPDVPFPAPERKLSLDERLFFSQLPQALSTRAEMMARYDSPKLDGNHICLQRVHVTGGTNGILVESLFRFRPFTPSFIGRAEDQAYLLSTFNDRGNRLAYLHQPGLIMRHDKRAFAQEAIQSARVGKLVGDYVRILYFSAYARTLDADFAQVKEQMDPFTGSFISDIPTTLTLLRFALKAEALFQAGHSELGKEFLGLGAQRINEALNFASQGLREPYLKERKGWDLYYDTLIELEKALEASDPFALELQRRTRQLVEQFTIQ